LKCLMKSKEATEVTGGNGYFSSFIEECCIVEEGRKFPIEASGMLMKHGAGRMGIIHLDKSYLMQNDGARLCCKRSGANGSRDWHGIGLADEGILL